MPGLVLVPEKSEVRIRTFAEGLFARLAHDLELSCHELEGRAEREARTATLEVPIGAITVVGVLQGARVDERALSASERADVLGKMKKDVFQVSGAATMRVQVTMDGASARVHLAAPNGRSIARTTRPELVDEPDGAVRVRGTLDVSLAALGSATVKGPMNAFRVKDRVEIVFDVVFAPEAEAQPA